MKTYQLRETGLELRLDRDLPVPVPVLMGQMRAIRVTKWGQYKPDVWVEGDRLTAIWTYRATATNARLFEKRMFMKVLSLVDVGEESGIDATDLRWGEA